MRRPRKTLRLTVAYDEASATVQSYELVDAAPVVRDPRPPAGSDAHWVAVEGAGARFARRLPDPRVGAEVFHVDGTITRTAPAAGRVVTIDVPWRDDGREVVFRAPAGDTPSASLAEEGVRRRRTPWRETGRFAPAVAPPSLAAEARAPPAFPATPLFAGSSARALKLVFLAEGFKESELAAYRAVVDSFVQRLRQTPPFNGMMGSLAGLRVDSVSPESGIDDPAAGTTVRTWLDGRFGVGDLRRLIEVDQTRALAAAARAAGGGGAFVGLVVANTAEYGGSGGQVAVFSRHAQAVDIALHELGHTLFGLADEYSDAGTTPGTPAEPNVTAKPDATSATWGPRDLDRLKWRAQVTPGLPLPTSRNPDCNQPHHPAGPSGVGVFEGGKYRHCGVFRPTADCKMRNLQQPFCPVCQGVIRARLAVFA